MIYVLTKDGVPIGASVVSVEDAMNAATRFAKISVATRRLIRAQWDDTRTLPEPFALHEIPFTPEARHD